MAFLIPIQPTNIDAPQSGLAPFYRVATTVSRIVTGGGTMTLTVASTAGLHVGDAIAARWSNAVTPASPPGPADFVNAWSNYSGGVYSWALITAVGANTIGIARSGSGDVTAFGVLVVASGGPGDGDVLYLADQQVTQTATMAATLAQVILGVAGGVGGSLVDDGNGNPLAVSGGVTLGPQSTLDGVTILGAVTDAPGLGVDASGSTISLAPQNSVTVLGPLSVTTAGSLTVGNDTMGNAVTFPIAPVDTGWTWAAGLSQGTFTGATALNGTGTGPGDPDGVIAFTASSVAGLAIGQVVLLGLNDFSTDTTASPPTWASASITDIDLATMLVTLAWSEWNGTEVDAWGNLFNGGNAWTSGWFAVLTPVASPTKVTDNGDGTATVQFGAPPPFSVGQTLYLGAGDPATYFTNNSSPAFPVSAAVAGVVLPSYAPSGAGLNVYGSCVLDPQQPIIQCGPIRTYAPVLPAADLVAAGTGYGYLSTPLAQSGVLDLPAAADVKQGVTYGAGAYAGTLASGGRTNIFL
jgi:hypothetical protein